MSGCYQPYLISSMHKEHSLPVRQNVIANLLSRYKFDWAYWDLLKSYVLGPIWIPTHFDLMCLNHNFEFFRSYQGGLTNQVFDRLFKSFRPSTPETK